MAKNGHFPQKRRKVGVPARGFTSTPRAGAPRFPGAEKGGIWTPWPGPGIRGSRGRPSGTLPGTLPGRTPPGPPAGNRGAPARGVDVKPPSAPGSGDPSGTRDPGFGVSGPPLPQGGGSRARDPGPPGPRVPGDPPGRVRGALLGLPGAWGRPGHPRRGLFYINPSRRGPAVPRGPGGVPGATPRGEAPRALRPRVNGIRVLSIRGS